MKKIEIISATSSKFHFVSLDSIESELEVSYYTDNNALIFRPRKNNLNIDTLITFIDEDSMITAKCTGLKFSILNSLGYISTLKVKSFGTLSDDQFKQCINLLEFGDTLYYQKFYVKYKMK